MIEEAEVEAEMEKVIAVNETEFPVHSAYVNALSSLSSSLSLSL